ncbi:hypothetical protein [Pseudomonas libanensis]|uniref:hypothetical protein n=1 Tax=Pseudomonas libanensis TaxID=75588 RepID=UPI000B276811|nr:hypothetical protein [Pseudomonas libanensis]
MNLDRDYTQDRAEPSVIGEKVHSRLCALNAVIGGKGESVTCDLNTFFDEPVLCQVTEVRIDSLICLRRAKIEVQAMRGREWVRFSCRLKNPLLKRSIQFHLSGLLGLLVWKPKATTEGPDTQFTRNTKSQAQKSQVHGLALCAAFTTKFWSE